MSVILDIPNESFKVGDYSLTKPFNGLNILQVISQTWGSTSERFPPLGSAHPDRSDFISFDIGQITPAGGGIATCIILYAKTRNKFVEVIRQPVQFAGIRMRSVPFKENYTKTTTTTKTQTTIINGTKFVVPVTRNAETIASRTLYANDVIVREPFTQDVYCERETHFVNLSNQNIEFQEPIQIRDSNKSKAREKIAEAYTKKQHPRTAGYSEPTLNFPAFKKSVLTPYYSETSSPSVEWYAGRVGGDGLVVMPTEVTQYIGGQLRMVVNLKTKYL